MATKEDKNFEDIKNEILNNIKKESSDNLFSILGIQNKELIHSRFMAYLLGNNGEVFSGNNDVDCLNTKHNYGIKFLNEFLTILHGTPYFKSKLKKGYKIEINKKNPKVYIEYEDKALVGRIDILIKFNSYWIAIENKIYASDQEAQLKRYHTFLKEKTKDEKFDLIYLTLDGHKPSEESVKDLSEKDYCIMTYKDIQTWIENILKIVEKDNSEKGNSLKEVINQYKTALNVLLEKQNTSKKIYEYYNNNNNLANFKSLLNGNDKVKNYTKDIFINYFYPSLIEQNFSFKENFEAEDNCIYNWVENGNNKRCDFYILFEFTETLQVYYYPVLHDRRINKKGKWYCVNNRKNKWIGWTTDKKKFFHKEKDINKFIEAFNNCDSTQLEGYGEMVDIIKKLPLPTPPKKTKN